MEACNVLGIDYGTKFVGLATGNTETSIAFPREVIENRSRIFLIERIRRICNEYEIGLIVVGWPRNMNDENESPIMKVVRAFVGNLEREMGIKVELFDERLSTFEARQMMDGFGAKRMDGQSAQIILQRYFNNI